MLVDKLYPIAMEISGPMASFSTPFSGSEQSTYPIMTPTAAKGILEAVLFLRHAEVVPVMLNICSPVRYMETDFNYRFGPLRKDTNIKNENGIRYQLTTLVDVKYQIFAVARDATRATAQHVSPASRAYYGKTNHAHAYQEIFNRRLRSGSWFTMPTLGKSMCIPDYVGPLRPETFPCQRINLSIPSMTKRIFSKPFGTIPITNGEPDFSKTERTFNLKITNGVAIFEPEMVAHVVPLAVASR